MVMIMMNEYLIILCVVNKYIQCINFIFLIAIAIAIARKEDEAKSDI